jgi:cell division protein FtsL
MTDWAEGIEIRNYGIKGGIDISMLSEFFKAALALALIAGSLLFYSWIQNQIVSMGYQSQNLFMQEELLRRLQKRLILEEETLRNPGRINFIARRDLGMRPLRPEQLLPTPRRAGGIRSSEAIAMAEPGSGVLKKAEHLSNLEIVPGN